MSTNAIKQTKVSKNLEKQLQRKLLNSPIFQQITLNTAPYHYIFNIINMVYELKNELQLGMWNNTNHLKHIEEQLNTYTASLKDITETHNINLSEAVKLYHIINLICQEVISNTSFTVNRS